ncbi:response regulator [Xanthocytophaga agilis]|uniref:Response regulator n=1 Tax=Xanthocytophaga agilis TaxID=3048010 RepID=A0AAE3UGZ5_9BACT|nr:response regulator [Xanthocytophaga agilis]MDJ1502113.1 response regulator [Xanthocytophaga agilis]
MNLSESLKNGPIIIIEDDQDDHFLMENVFTELQTRNQRLYFTKGIDALQYLQTTDQIPFLIICDLMLPQQSGIDLKKQIDQDPILRQRSIPFVFMSTSFRKELVSKAYLELTIQGVFQKPNDYDQLKRTLDLLIGYWSVCEHPEPMHN